MKYNCHLESFCGGVDRFKIQPELISFVGIKKNGKKNKTFSYF
jgi:hypothetical protein